LISYSMTIKEEKIHFGIQKIEQYSRTACVYGVYKLGQTPKKVGNSLAFIYDNNLILLEKL